MHKPCVLIVGASGLVGTAAARAFSAAGWQVIAISRRSPELLEPGTFTHLAVDLQDPAACTAAAAQMSAVTHVVYTAVFELPGLVSGWSDPIQIDTNGQMLRNLLEPLCAHARLEHVCLLQGTKAYGAAVQPMRVPARESQPRVEHPNFYWLQEDYLVECAKTHQFHYTILRPQLIVGPNHGVVMNLPPVIGAFAALRHTQGLSVGFPGGADWVWQAVDVRLVANACLWSAQTPAAAGQTFNLTNGEVFTWRDMWPAITRTLGVERAQDEPVSLADYLNGSEAAWADIVARYNLQPIPLTALLGESHYYADLCFAYGSTNPPPPALVSTIKIRQAGFMECMNTEASFCHWLEDLQQRRVIPRFN
ncbi:MAG: NAD-dependent epimerase/dehydratase family protein [Pseudomonadota bacterium]